MPTKQPRSTASHARRWIDVSVPLRSGMVRWPEDPPVRIERTLRIERGDEANFSVLSMGAHTGTHMDAPFHFLRSEKGMDRMPLDATVGPARVISIRNPRSITPEELRLHQIRRGERLLFKTRNSARCWKTNRFVENFVHFSLEAARYLARRRVKSVGIDYLSVGGYGRDDGPAVHRVLLRAGIWIIEGLNLSRVRPGFYELFCLPLKIERGDGAPARAILRPIPLDTVRTKRKR